MDIAALFMHNFRAGTCPAWMIEGADAAEAERIANALTQYINYEQDSGFNEWRIWRVMNTGRFGAKQFTWDRCWYGTLDELLAKFATYYEKQAG